MFSIGLLLCDVFSQPAAIFCDKNFVASDKIVAASPLNLLQRQLYDQQHTSQYLQHNIAAAATAHNTAATAHNTTQHSTSQYLQQHTAQHNSSTTAAHNTRTQHKTAKYSTQHTTAAHNTTQHSTTQQNTAQHNSSTQHSTEQHNTAQHRTAQNNSSTTQYNSTAHLPETCSTQYLQQGQIRAGRENLYLKPLGSGLREIPMSKIYQLHTHFSFCN